MIAVVVNFTPVLRPGYGLTLPGAGGWREILNSDGEIYGGGGAGNPGLVVTDAHGNAAVTLPPLAAIMLEYVG
jgi:1,4-alpha-glucan branching enzyme